jgi:hypothetical protein
VNKYFCWAVWLALFTLGVSGCGQSAATEQKAELLAVSNEPNQAKSNSPPAVEAANPSAAANSSDASDAATTATASQAKTTPADAPKAKAAPADRTPTRPGDAEKITFDDLNLNMQADMVFRDKLVPEDHRVHELEGKRVSIVGYMHAGQAAQRGIKEFILLKNTQCKFGPGGQADHLATIILRRDNAVAFTPRPVKVEGTLKLSPFEGPDGNTWSIYRLEDALVR